MTSFGGVRIEKLHPFGGPLKGGTSVTLIGRHFRRMSKAPAVCNFGNATSSAEGTPLGGPARTIRAGLGEGQLPWHVPATILNGTHAVCISPPLTTSENVTYLVVNVDLSLNGQLPDRTDSRVAFEYYGPSVLSVRWIYPIAGPKTGGTTVTVYGTGFKSLGQEILIPPSLVSGQSSSRRGIKCIFGDLPMVDANIMHPIGSKEARPALGDTRNLLEDDEPLAAAIECLSPPWSNTSMYYAGTSYGVSSTTPQPNELDEEDRCSVIDGLALCQVDEPKKVCLRVTLNDDPMQHSEDCVLFTYYDE